MRTFILTILLTFGLAFSAKAVEKAKPPSTNPQQVYDAAFATQTDVVNQAINAYIDLPCSTDATTVKVAYEKVGDELTKLISLSQHAPDNEDVIDQAKQLEIVYGILYLFPEWDKKSKVMCGITEPDTEKPNPNTTSSLK